MKLGLHLGTDHPQGRAQGVKQALETAQAIGARSVQLALCNMIEFFSDLDEKDLSVLDSAGKSARDAGMTVIVHHCWKSVV